MRVFGPPIIHEERVYTDSATKAIILRKTLPKWRMIEEDIAWSSILVECFIYDNIKVVIALQ